MSGDQLDITIHDDHYETMDSPDAIFRVLRRCELQPPELRNKI